MDDFLVKILPQAPPLVVMVVLVWVFLRAMEKRDLLFTNTMRSLHGEHLEAREASREAIKENAVNTKENTSALNKLTTTIEVIKMKSGL